jgi:creatinine amidohydrolase
VLWSSTGRTYRSELTHIRGYALAERLARRLGDALAPVVTLGFSEANMPMAGTVSLEIPTFQAVVVDVCRSLARHGFQEVLLVPSHAGNYPVLRDVLVRVRQEHRNIRILARTDLDVEGTRQFAAREGVEMACLGAHAGQAETSQMLAYRPDLVQMDKACAGFTGDRSSYIPEFLRSGFLPPVDLISSTGILGDARGSTKELGEKMLEHITERFVRMMGAGNLG